MKEQTKNWKFYGQLFEFFKIWELWWHTRTDSLIFQELQLWILRISLTTFGSVAYFNNHPNIRLFSIHTTLQSPVSI